MTSEKLKQALEIAEIVVKSPLQEPSPKGGNSKFLIAITMNALAIALIDLNKENEELKDENKSLQSQLENKSREIGRSEHRGNTVDYIYDKLETYSRQLGDASDRIRAFEKEIDDAAVVAHVHGDAHWWVSDKPNHYHTHKARLVRIEEIKELK